MSSAAQHKHSSGGTEQSRSKTMLITLQMQDDEADLERCVGILVGQPTASLLSLSSATNGVRSSTELDMVITAKILNGPATGKILTMRMKPQGGGAGNKQNQDIDNAHESLC